MNQRQRITNDSVNCALGLFNGMLISLPIWGLIYILFHLLVQQ